MRISDNMQLDAINRSLAANQTRYAEASREASSGSRIGAPSDDPVAAAQAVRAQAALNETNGFLDTIGKVRGDAELSESTLADASSLVSQVHDLALQGANGSQSAATRLSLGNEVAGLREQLLSLANQKGSNGYLFGGSRTQAAPFDPSGAFQGNDDARSANVGPQTQMTVNTSGAQAFTSAGGRDIFADLDALATALQTNNVSGIQAGVNNLDTGFRQLVAARSDAGLKVARLDSAQTAHQTTQVAVTTQLHQIVDADSAEAYAKLIAAQQSMEQAMSTARLTLATLSAAHAN